MSSACSCARAPARSASLRIESVRPTPKETLVVFEGVSGRTAAEALVGATVLAFREDLEPPAEGEYFQGDLVGLTAVDEAGKVLGRVEELWRRARCPTSSSAPRARKSWWCPSPTTSSPPWTSRAAGSW